ncbi:MAG: DUF5685 family protein [Oscillospiraceae bacterium]|jgi:hypothetical protein|nr:DUF5685 family protein [Oscillospiraceae bacterium]
MFGYIKPYQPELKFREMAQYRSAYCGLCHTLSKRYGIFSRLLVNYDFVLPAMLFWSGPYNAVKRRCARHPFAKNCCLCESAALNYSADALILFTDWKLRDAVSDARFALLARLMRLFYRKAFRKAAERLPEESIECARRMDEIRQLEGTKDTSLGAAYAFGSMLACLSRFYGGSDNQRAAHSLFFHLGSWITIADAIDDTQRDSKSGNYNAVTASGLERESIFALLGREQELALAAFDLLPENVFTDIIGNILSMGLQSRGHELYTKGGAAHTDEGSV